MLAIAVKVGHESRLVTSMDTVLFLAMEVLFRTAVLRAADFTRHGGAHVPGLWGTHVNDGPHIGLADHELVYAGPKAFRRASTCFAALVIGPKRLSCSYWSSHLTEAGCYTRMLYLDHRGDLRASLHHNQRTLESTLWSRRDGWDAKMPHCLLHRLHQESATCRG